MTAVFEIGKTYWTRYICDNDLIARITVCHRTPKTLKTAEGKTYRIKNDAGVEWVSLGSYSMAPSIRANKVES